MIKINATKTNLNKILKWSSSRFNELHKSEVIDRILKYIKKGNDVSDLYSTGCYSKSGSGSGTDYKFEIINGRNYLSIGYIEFLDFVVKKKVELIKGERGKYPVPKTFKI